MPPANEDGNWDQELGDKFQLGKFLREARLQKGLSQEALALKCGTNKAYISKVENNQKNIRFSSLKKLIEEGLEGQLNMTIRL